MERFTLWCDDPYISCCKAERELERLKTDNTRLQSENAQLKAQLDKAVEDTNESEDE